MLSQSISDFLKVLLIIILCFLNAGGLQPQQLLLRSSDGREVPQHSQARALWRFLGLSSHTRPRVPHGIQGRASRGAAPAGWEARRASRQVLGHLPIKSAPFAKDRHSFRLVSSLKSDSPNPASGFLSHSSVNKFIGSPLSGHWGPEEK